MLSRDLWKKKPSTWTVIGLAPDRVIVKPVVFPGHQIATFKLSIGVIKIFQRNQAERPVDSIKIHQVSEIKL